MITNNKKDVRKNKYYQSGMLPEKPHRGCHQHECNKHEESCKHYKHEELCKCCKHEEYCNCIETHNRTCCCKHKHKHKSNKTNKNNAPNKNISFGNSFLLCDSRLDISDEIFSTILYIPWSVEDYTNFTHGKIIFSAEINEMAYLEIQVVDSINKIILGSSSIITTSGLHTFAVTNPTTDTVLYIQFRKTSGVGNYPEISGMVLRYQ